MKYIIESNDVIGYTPKYAMLFGDGYMIQRLEDLEELNSDYINEHFSDLQDTAYQRGLDDAWEAARKIVCDEELDWNTLLHLFNRSNFEGIFGDFSPSEAIDKLKSYKEKQKADDEIKVGDEVRLYRHNVPYIVTSCDGDDDTYILMTVNGGFIKAGKYNVRKTGRHFDIPKILEEMRHD